MKILVINAGSSSLKYQLINMDDGAVMAKGNCERIGIDGRISYKTATASITEDAAFPTHTEAFAKVVEFLTTGENKVVDSISDITAVGHRALHGGEIYKSATLITDEVIDTIMELRELGPLHNPPQAVAMRACQEVFGKETPMVAIFDTSFGQTMPRQAYIFPIPYEYYEKYSIRRYGFHGTSHRFVSQAYAKKVGKDIKDLKIVTCHLGNGSSITAVDGGKSVDTTMGFTPLDGVIMGTRSGCIDASAVLFLMEKTGMTAAQMSDYLNKKSGFLGLSGISSDNREIDAGIQAGNERCALVHEILGYQIKKQIGAYAAAMGGLDAVIFTGGIGENVARLRSLACSNMEKPFGIKFDEELNETMNHGEGKISAADSEVEVWILPTNEELLIAMDTAEIVSK